MTIALVDVDKKSLKSLMGCMERLFPDEDLIIFTSYSSAYEYMLHNPVDLLMTEIILGKQTGFYLFNEIIRIQPGLRVIFLSEYEEFALDSFRYRAIDYIVKPINDDKVREAMSEAKMLMKI